MGKEIDSRTYMVYSRNKTHHVSYEVGLVFVATKRKEDYGTSARTRTAHKSTNSSIVASLTITNDEYSGHSALFMVHMIRFGKQEIMKNHGGGVARMRHNKENNRM